MIYNHFDKAKRTARGIITLCLLCMMPFITACLDREDELPDNSTVPLTFYLQTAGSQQTRAYIGDVPGSNPENYIGSIKAWLFADGNCVSYSERIDVTDGVNRVTMDIPQNLIGKTADLYIIANDGEGLGAGTGLNNLTTALLTSTKFTAANPTTEDNIGSGLPMSRIVKGCNITSADGIQAKIDDDNVILLTRAVSKIRFAFARTKEHPGEVLGITLNANQIASQEYIFPVDPATNTADYTDPYLGDLHANIVSGSYENTVMTIGIGSTDVSADPIVPIVPFGDKTITEVFSATDLTVDPTIYTWANWSTSEAVSSLSNQEKAVTYNELMNAYTIKNIYLRESDKQLEGKIYYRLSPTGTIKSATFRMISPSDVQDFARNHIWIVYGYFLGDKFNLIVQTIPWEDSFITLNYTETVSWKDGGEPVWTPTLTSDNSCDETIDGITYKVIHTNGGDTPSMSFTLDSPEGWQWIAVLEPLTSGAGDFISFADGTSVATGDVGLASTLNIKIATTSTSVVHRARLRLLVRTPSGDQSLEVQPVKYIISRNN